MQLVTTEQMRHLEQRTVDAGATWAGLMEQAGWGVAQEGLRRLGNPQERRVLILVGPGNNGGDGLVVARHLHDAGAQVSLYIWKRNESPEDANRRRCRRRDIPEIAAADDADRTHLRQLLTEADLIVDALLGMGTSRPVAGDLAEIVTTVNHLSKQHTGSTTPGMTATILAIDVPTGIHSDSGAVLEVALHADITVATGLPKRGLLFYPGKLYAGELTLADIGIPPRDLEMIMSEVITAEQARALLPARPEDSHKGTFGKVMIVAGSLHYPGAATLATTGAGRVGAGLVTLATARSVLLAGGRGPEVTLLPLPEAELGTLGLSAAEELLKNLDGYQALLVGPGLGQEEPTSRFIQRLFGMEQSRKRPRVGFRIQEEQPETPSGQTEPPQLPPTVIDADGLNLLSAIEDWPERLNREHFILTPHPGEMKRLLQVEELADDPVEVATDAAARWNQVVVFKGATTVIAAPDGRSVVHAVGNPALATAGTGDVLSGAIAGLLAQGLKLFDAAVLGVYLHAAAGALVREELGEMGTLASDLFTRLPRVIKGLTVKG